MIRSLRVSSGSWFIVPIALLMASCTNTKREGTFVGVVERERVGISCDGGAMVDSACRLEIGNAGDPSTVRFLTERTRYAPLFKKEVQRVTGDDRNTSKPAASDIVILHSLTLEECHPAERSKGWSGDFLQLCLPSDSSAVVLFFRGLCDKCTFEPVVLRRRADH